MKIQSKFRTLYKLLYTKYILNYINILETGNENRFMDFFFFCHTTRFEVSQVPDHRHNPTLTIESVES